ncbi:MAG: glycosyltransferase family 4 protein [Bacteriovoracia bacterium]
MAKPKIVIDARMITREGHGISLYVQDLIHGLARMRDASPLAYEPVFLIDASMGPGTPGSAVWRGFATETVGVPFLNPRELVALPGVIRRLRPALYHSPSFSSLWWCPVPWLVTVHDLNHLIYGNWAHRAYYRAILRPFMRGARKLLTVSQFSRSEIAKWLGMDPLTIEVVENAIDFHEEKSDDAILERFGLRPGKYFFCASHNKPHKNLPILARAYDELGTNADWPLVLTTHGVSSQNVKLIQTGNLSRPEFYALLKHAGTLVFPSVYEGFGRPPLEGLLAGVPVIVSDIPPHREALAEVQATEARFVIPLDVAGIAEALRAAMRGELKKPSAATQAAIQRRFSVESLAAKMDRIYRIMLETTATRALEHDKEL